MIESNTIERFLSRNFITIDVETANESRNSICSIGLSIVENGFIKQTFSSLIRPPELRFRTINTQIHGINSEMVKDAPTILDFFKDVALLFKENIVLAHNASFDIGCLKQSLHSQNHFIDIIPNGCTIKIAQNAFPDQIDYKLSTLANSLNIPLIHHNSQSDSEACARLAIACWEKIDFDRFVFDNEEITILFGQPIHGKQKGLSSVFTSKKIDSNLKNMDLSNANPEGAFYSKKIVFTGDLMQLSRNEAALLVQKMGADVNSSISKLTNFVVVGQNPGPSKMEKIKELNEKGAQISIITEAEFLEKLKG